MIRKIKTAVITLLLFFNISIAFSQVNMLADIPNRDPADPVYSYVEKMPMMSGGIKNLRMYSDYYPYPPCGLEHRMEGKVILQLVVEKNGDISDVKVLKSPDECLSKAAIEYVNQWPKWEPAQVNEKVVSSLFTLPIDYNIEQYNSRPK